MRCVVACGAAGVPGAFGPGRCARRWAAAFLRALLVAPLVLRAPSGPAAREIAARELHSERSISKPGLALPPLTSTLHIGGVCSIAVAE